MSIFNVKNAKRSYFSGTDIILEKTNNSLGLSY